MICAIAELARAGLISRTLWSENAQTLLQALLSIMKESLKGQTDEACVGGVATGTGVGGSTSTQRTQPDGKWGEKGLCGWLHTLLRAAAPAASFEAAAPLLSKPPFVRVLVQVRMCFLASLPSSLSHVSPRARCLFELIRSARAP